MNIIVQVANGLLLVSFAICYSRFFYVAVTVMTTRLFFCELDFCFFGFCFLLSAHVGQGGWRYDRTAKKKRTHTRTP